MALNPAYEAIGKGFVQQYYALFDDPNERSKLVNLYNTETSFMTFEGIQLQGALKIMEKLSALTFQKINRIITSVDSQPMFDGGVLINVLGRLKTDDDPPHASTRQPLTSADEDPPLSFSQTFILKPLGSTYYCQHDIFRLGLHDTS
ncbi:hypothetical protein O3M35_010850 [Rhynocoris fuscipes]|uniref:NTF2-related export protein n=1 Tax=Rhynocoris fuscipes TaxID=488301 RepID=A0AAW1D1H5_9HEMI